MKAARRFIRLLRKAGRHDGYYIAHLFSRFDDWGRPEDNR